LRGHWLHVTGHSVKRCRKDNEIFGITDTV
jgi:hypothetical protein